MKKIIAIALILGISITAKGQELFASATNKSLDGYVTAGYIKNGWGIYAGAPYNEQNLASPHSGTLSSNLKYGIIRTIAADKWMVGAGVQPTTGGNRLNAFLGFNPLKSKDMKLWMIGNIVGSQFAAGLGLSYKLK
jgi:hypothetical protein